jgi:hypothetical protein
MFTHNVSHTLQCTLLPLHCCLHIRDVSGKISTTPIFQVTHYLICQTLHCADVVKFQWKKRQISPEPTEGISNATGVPFDWLNTHTLLVLSTELPIEAVLSLIRK